MHTALSGSSAFLRSNSYFQQYMLVVQPEEKLCSRIMAEKQALTSRYAQQPVTLTGLHITIADFMAKEEMEETLIRWMQRAYSAQRSFSVTTGGFSGFPPGTIYVQIPDPAALLAIAQPLRVLDPYISSADCPPVRLAARPYLTLARLLSAEDYSNAVKTYTHKTFNDSFTVNEVVLLKKNLHDDACSRVNVFRFLPES